MTPPVNAPEESDDLPVAQEPPEDQVRGMATAEDLAGVDQEEETV